MKTVHALIVGIDKYPIPAHQLNGCVNDATEFANYIKTFAQKAGFGYDERRLFDADAARMNIVNSFKMFDNAASGDICVYYYSGHGSQMKAPPEFWDETDGMSETIVCYDSRLQNPGCRDMADKEIGYLIHKATSGKDVHFLAVTDCCHSGSNTRDLDIKARMAETCPTAPRGVEDYVGFKDWGGIQPPAAKHIHLAAAKDDETAKEYKINGISRGVFTFSIVEALTQAGGNLSYSELLNRVRLKCRNRVEDQTPLLNAYVATDDVRLSFMGETQPVGGFFLVGFDKINGWQVNAGGAQGLNTEGATFKLDNGATVSTAKVGANTSTINGAELLDQTAQYRATLVSMALPKVKIAISKDSDAAGAVAIKKVLKDADGLQLVDNEKDTDYVARAWDGMLRLTTVDSTSPLFRRVKGYDDTAAATFLERCQSVGNWKRKLELANPLTTIKDSDVEIQYFDGDGKATSDAVFRQSAADQSAYMQLSVTNRGQQALWVSAVYFGSDFTISNQFMRQKFVKPGETAWIEFENSKNIPLNVPTEYLTWGVNELTEYIKVFVSTDKIDTDLHNQDGLPLDERSGATRAIGKAIGMATPPVPMDDWRTFERPYHLVCPMTARNLSPSATVSLGNITLNAPAGFSAKASLSTSSEAKRAVATAAATSSRDVNAAPSASDSMKILRGDFSSAALADGMGNAPPLDVVELENVVGTLSRQNPLTFQLPKPDANDVILPLGYDAESGLYFPIGSVDKEGLVSVHTLPPPSVTTRSLMSSVKIFFKKMTQSSDYHFPMLRMVNFDKRTDSDSFTYETDQTAIIAAVKSAKRVVLFIHGIIGTTEDQPRALRRPITEGSLFQNPYDVALTFDYESMNTSIEITAADFKAALEAVGIKVGHGKTFDIVAHSMGGLVSRWFIEKLGGNQIVSRLFMLGTPNAGSEITDLEKTLTGAITMAVNGVAFLHPWLFALNWAGKFLKKGLVTVEQQQPNSPFLQTLNSAPDAGVPYHIVIGNTKLMENQKPEQYSLMKKIIKVVEDRKLYTLADFYFGEANDMAVRIESIKSAGNQTKVTRVEVACDHFTYFNAQTEGIQALAASVRAAD